MKVRHVMGRLRSQAFSHVAPSPFAARWCDSWRHERMQCAAVWVLVAALCLTMHEVRPFSTVAWVALAGVVSLAFGLLGVRAADEWRDDSSVWVIATFCRRADVIGARIAFAASAAIATCGVALLALPTRHWCALSLERTLLWAMCIGAAALTYYVLGYCLGLCLPRVAPAALVLLWSSALLDRHADASAGPAAGNVLRYALPPYTLFAPAELWADFPINPRFTMFVIVYVAAVSTTCGLMAYLLVSRDVPVVSATPSSPPAAAQ